MTDRLRHTIAKLEKSEFIERQRAMVTLESISEAVITADPSGKVTYVNTVAERLTGFSFREAIDQQVADVFRIVNEQSRVPASDPIAHCLASDRIVGAADGTSLLSRDGREYSINHSARLRSTNRTVKLSVWL